MIDPNTPNPIPLGKTYLLKDKLNPSHFRKLQSLYPYIRLDETQLVYEASKDGPLGKMATVRGTIFGYPNKIYLDSADFNPAETINPFHPLHGLVLCHELVHLQQAQRGFWTRVRMWWARLTQPYPEGPDYASGSWHEVEAHEKDDILLSEWKSLIQKEN